MTTSYGNLTNGTAAFLFLGSNTTLYAAEDGGAGIDLTDLPSTYRANGYNLSSDASPPRLASLLLCDPQVTLSPSTVTITQDGFMEITRDVQHDSSFIPNMDFSAAETITATSLLAAVAALDQYSSLGSPQIMSSLSADALFMSSPTANWTPPNTQIAPLPLAKINTQMDLFVTSAAKAYSTGLSPSWFPIFMTYPATLQTQRLALQSNTVVYIIVWILFAILALSLAWILRNDRPGQASTHDGLVSMVTLAAPPEDDQERRRNSEADSIADAKFNRASM